MPAEPLVCQLPEYQQIEVGLTDGQARQLQAAAGTRLTLTPSAHGYLVRASSHVGSIAVPGIVLHVLPKVPVANVLHLMTWSTERIAFSQDESAHAAGSLTAAVAAWYARMLERTLVLGVDRSYVEEADQVVALRGRIDWPAQIGAVGLPTPIACRYDEWSLDTRANRIVAAAALALLRNPAVPPQSAFTLRRLLKLLAGVSPLRPDDLHAHDVLTRLNEHYRTVVQLARLVLHAGGPAQGAGHAAVSSFMVNMNDVFEDCVFASLKQRLRGTWGVEKRKVPLDIAGHVPTEPDLLFTDRFGTNVLVADSKYKLTSDGRGRNADYYQLLAYCTSLGLHRGVLIYCDTDGNVPAPPRSIHVREASTVLETFRVRLAGSFDDIASEFDRLAEHLRGRADAWSQAPAR